MPLEVAQDAFDRFVVGTHVTVAFWETKLLRYECAHYKNQKFIMRSEAKKTGRRKIMYPYWNTLDRSSYIPAHVKDVLRSLLPNV